MKAEQLQRLHEAGMQVLQRTGVVFRDVETVQLLASHGLTVDGCRVFIPPETIADALSTVPGSFVVEARQPEPRPGDRHRRTGVLERRRRGSHRRGGPDAAAHGSGPDEVDPSVPHGAEPGFARQPARVVRINDVRGAASLCVRLGHADRQGVPVPAVRARACARLPRRPGDPLRRGLGLTSPHPRHREQRLTPAVHFSRMRDDPPHGLTEPTAGRHAGCPGRHDGAGDRRRPGRAATRRGAGRSGARPAHPTRMPISLRRVLVIDLDEHRRLRSGQPGVLGSRRSHR